MPNTCYPFLTTTGNATHYTVKLPTQDKQVNYLNIPNIKQSV